MEQLRNNNVAAGALARARLNIANKQFRPEDGLIFGAWAVYLALPVVTWFAMD